MVIQYGPGKIVEIECFIFTAWCYAYVVYAMALCLSQVGVLLASWLSAHVYYTLPSVTLQLHNFDLLRTCRTSSFCIVVWQFGKILSDTMHRAVPRRQRSFLFDEMSVRICVCVSLQMTLLSRTLSNLLPTTLVVWISTPVYKSCSQWVI